MALDGEQSGLFEKTLNGLSSLGDSLVGDLVVTGTLTVQGTSSFEKDINMNFNQINNLLDGVLLQDAATVSQITGIGVGVFLKLDGSDTMGGNIQMGTNQITGLADGTAAQDAVTVNQLTTAGGAFLKLDGSTTMGGNIAVGANQITGLADGGAATDGATYGQTILRDGTNTMLGDLDMNNNNIANALATTTDSLTVTGTSTAGIGSVALNGLAYTYPALAPALVGQTLQNTTIVSPYTLAWTTPATPVIAVDSGTGQTDLAIMGTAPILSGAVGTVQPLYGGTIVQPSARINMDTGALTIPNIVCTSGTAPQIYIKSSTTQNGIILGDAALSPNICSVFANGLMAVEASTDVELSYGLGGAIASKCGFSFNGGEVMRVDDEGYLWAINPTTSLLTQTSLPRYWRTAYNFTVKQQTGQTSGSPNWFVLPNPVGALFSNGSASTIGYECTRTLLEFDALNPISGTEGGGVGGCFIIPANGRVVKVSCIKPLQSSSIQMALRQGSVPMTNAALSDVCTYTGSAGGNTEVTFGAPTANLIGGAFWCIKILVDNFTHAAGADCYNFCVVMEFEYT